MQNYICIKRHKIIIIIIFLKSEGRRIPESLRTVLTVDAYLTDAFVNLVEKFLPLRQLEIHYKFLEVCLIIYLFIYDTFIK